jgi:glutaredoxin
MNLTTRLSALPLSLGLPFGLLLIAASALAQPVYRNVDKNGKISFSDQAPAANAQPAAARPGISSPNTDGLPYELRQVVQRYPVMLYTSDECAPCASARSLLVTRGVPFDERQIKTDADTAALQRLSGQTSLPLLSIGSQQLKGFSDAEWSQYLDAANYPKSSQLPAGYRSAPAQPLVALSPAPGAAPNAPGAQGSASAPAAAAPPPTPQSVNNGPTPSNPAGIKF